MTWTAPTITRPEPAIRNPERAALEDWLRFHRQTLLTKCAGLTGDQLKLASVEPSNLTLLGLVRHLTDVERTWFRIRFVGEQIPRIYCSDLAPDGDLDGIADADPAADLETFISECAAVDEAVRSRGLDETWIHHRTRQPMDLRWIFLHMIEEYARHNGHADLIRERIDGVTGS